MEVFDDTITVEEIEDLCRKVEAFYAERGNPKINIVWLADLILKRLTNDLDYYINVEGTKGFGKSNLILLLSLIQCRYSGIWENTITKKKVKVYPRTKPLPKEWKHIEYGFQFKKNMSFLDDAGEMKKKFYSIDKYMPFIVDEGSKNLHKYQWATKLQFMLVQMSDTERYQNKSFYICFPNFKELNPTFRNDRVNMRLYLFNKNVTKHYAQCIISIRDVNRHVLDKWHTDDNAKKFEDLLRNVPTATRAPHHVLYAESKLQGYAGYFDVPELKIIAPRIWDIYMHYKITNAQRQKDDTPIEEEESKRMQSLKLNNYRLIQFLKLKFPDISNVKIGEIMNCSASFVSKSLNENNRNFEETMNYLKEIRL